MALRFEPRSVQRVAGPIAGAGVLALVSWLLMQDPSVALAPAAPASTAAELAWHAGDRRAYRLTIDADVALDPDGPATVAHALHARLQLRVVRVDGDDADVAFQLGDVDYRVGGRTDARRAAALGVPFVARFERGMPQRFRFPAGLDGDVQEQLAEVVRTFQVTVPDPGVASWTALEEHGSGRYRAAYARAADGDGWHRRKAAHLRGAGVSRDGTALGVATVRVLRSDATLVPAAQASWWDRVDVVDDIELSQGGRVVARVATRSTLRAADASWDPAAAIAASARVERLLAEPVPVLETEGEQEMDVTVRAATAADRERLRDLIARFTASRGDELGFVHELAALLREVPELAAELPPQLKDAALPGGVAAGLAHALGFAGNPACQTALGDVCAATDAPVGNRVRAIVALGGVAHPTGETTALLAWLGAERGAGAAAEDLGNTALLALGRVGNTLHESGDAGYADVAAGLARHADDGRDAGLRAVALKAIANTRDPGLAAPAVRALDAVAAPVRAAAAQALAAVRAPGALDLLTDRLPVEGDGRVRAALVESMRATGAANDRALTACTELVELERDRAARGAMARYLVEHLDHHPDARATLERIVRTETDPRTLAYVAGRLHRTARDGR